MTALACRLLTLLALDIKTALRHPGDILSGLVFFLIIIALLPLGLGPDAPLLAMIAPGMIWIAVMLAMLPQIERLHATHHSTGALELALISDMPPPLIVCTRMIAAWIIVIIPFALAAPVMGLMLGLGAPAMAALTALVALGGFGLTLIGSMAAALTLGSRRAGILTAIIILPLAMPLLIFGTAALNQQLTNSPDNGHLKLLLAAVLVLAAITPPFTAIALRFAEE